MIIILNSLSGELLISGSLVFSSWIFILFFHLEHSPLTPHFVDFVCFYELGKTATSPGPV